MILKNGKRIDGCTDTLPVGTVQPFLGLTPPLGYLVCQGQLISKVEYPELYRICGSTFGTETDTHFYLPDLRGKTIAGYDSGDTAMNTIGKLLGNKTHTHTSAAHTHTIAGHVHSTGNHTLTADEIPHIEFTVPHIAGTEDTRSISTGGVWSEGSSYIEGMANDSLGKTIKRYRYAFGGSGTHNHGNTGSTALTSDSTTPGATGSNTNFQPTVIMNWIVKAVMLIPEYFIVENTLTSTSTSNALSAAQGKILNDKFNNYLTHSNLDIVVNNVDVHENISMYGSKNFCLYATANGQEWSFDLNTGSEDKKNCFFQFWSSTNASSIMELYNDDNSVHIKNGHLYLNSGYAYLNAANNGEAFFEVSNKETGHGARLGVGSGKVNHGVWSNHHGKWMVYGDTNGIYLNGRAETCSWPSGFVGNGNGTWGNQTGYLITDWQDNSGGDIQFRGDNPSSGKMSCLIDGYWYQREGVYRCIDTSEYSSSRDSKTNIKPTSHTNALEEISRIEIVDFNFKDEERKDEPKIGFIADDTDSIFSGLNKDKMDVYNCIGMLLKAVQELNKKVQMLENK